MLNFCLGIILGIVLGVIVMAIAATNGNYTKIEDAYYKGVEDGKAMSNT